MRPAGPHSVAVSRGSTNRFRMRPGGWSAAGYNVRVLCTLEQSSPAINRIRQPVRKYHHSLACLLSEFLVPCRIVLGTHLKHRLERGARCSVLASFGGGSLAPAHMASVSSLHWIAS